MRIAERAIRARPASRDRCVRDRVVVWAVVRRWRSCTCRRRAVLVGAPGDGGFGARARAQAQRRRERGPDLRELLVRRVIAVVAVDLEEVIAL